ncbi:hypothetical protein L7F22_063838 [Adiantum nelumboides]|nr:hypothetical protein [Adiantum nelumboides]
MEDVAPQKRRAQRSPTPTKRKRSPHSPLHHESKREEKNSKKKKERKRSPSSPSSSPSSSLDESGGYSLKKSPRRGNRRSHAALRSVLNDAFKNMYKTEKRSKKQLLINSSSKVIIKFLTAMQKFGYMGEFELVDHHRAGKIIVQLNGRLNKCGVISLQYNVAIGELEAWTTQLLLSRQV